MNIGDIIDQAQRLERDFVARTQGIPYETKGILFSELLFVVTICRALGAKRILESGRARGQSTHVLAAAAPDIPLVSIEFDSKSADVPIAAARLAPFDQVRLLFGDATKLAPRMVEVGDVVLIDGPKGFRGLRLAARLLATKRPLAVLVHDCDKGSVERTVIERLFRGVICSDDWQFCQRFMHLDNLCLAVDSHVLRRAPSAHQSYGPTMGCIMPQPNVNYWRLLAKIGAAGLAAKLSKPFRSKAMRG